MSDAQALIINSASTTLIDNLSNALAVRAKGSGSGNFTVPLPSNSVAPVLALAGSADVYGAGPWSVSGSSGTTNWWVFDTILTASSAGMLLLKADGTVAFDALQEYAVVVDVLSGPDANTGTGTFTYPAGRTYAVAFLKSSWFSQTIITPTGNGYYTFHNYFRRVSSSVSGASITLSKYEITGQESMPTQTPPNNEVSSESWTAAVLDVTGY